jgi:5'-nucleotidase / UDP-sugar diphosphatase
MLAMVCVMVVAPVGGGAAQKAQALVGARDFTILHTNDEHSELHPYDLAMDYPGSPTTGGFSRLARAIGDIKAAKASAGEPVLTLGAGDWSQGSLFSWLETAAAPELTLMQQMGYDAVTIGNHELELGPQYLAAELAAAKGNGVNLPVLSSNIKFSGTPPNPSSPDAALYNFYSATDKQRSDLYIQPYTTRTLSNGLKVGIFGLLGVEAEAVAPGEAPLSFGNDPANPTGITSFLHRVSAATDMVNTLRNTENCDVVVCMSHMGTYEEELLSAFLPSIDVIVGGHSHDLNYPPIIWSTNSTIIVQAKAYTEYLGELELKYDPAATGPKVTVRGAKPIHMDNTVGTVPAIDTVINNYLAAINAHLGFNSLSHFAETDFNGDGGFPIVNREMSESNLGDLIADTYKTAVNQADPAHPVQFTFEANGTIRAGLVKGATGVFSFYDIYRSLPLGGSPYDPTTPGYPLVSFYLYGAELQGVMNQVLDMNTDDFFLQVSSMKYTYDPNAAKGKKLVSMSVDNGSGVYEPVNPGTLYHFATNYYVGSFLALFGLYPRDGMGAQHKPPTYPDPMKEFIVHTTGPTVELKAWQALTGVVANMPDLDGDGLPNIPATYYAPQERVTKLSTNFYFAEGTCRPGFDPYIALLNPGTADARVKITYMLGDGTSKTQDILVPAGSRATAHPPDVLGTGDDPSHDFSAKVECTNGKPIIAERPVYFNYNGVWTGGHDVMGVTSLARTFYFAEGTCRPGFDPYFSIVNPGGTDAQVTITYMKGDGTTDTQEVTITKGSRATVAVKDKLGVGDDDAHDFSAKVACWNEQDILVERPMYFNYRGEWTGGSDVMGVTTPSPTYYFAEGTCRPGFDPYIAIANPQVYDTIVKVTYSLGDGSSKRQDILVPAGSRRTVHPPDVIGVGSTPANDFSALVESTNNAPIVVERPMYFNYQGAWTGGSDVVGASMPAQAFQFAEGTCRPGFDPYIAIANPSSDSAIVKITYSLGDGSAKTQDIVVPAHSRQTVHPPDVLGTGDDAAHDFSVKIECTNGLPIVAERPMYFDYKGWTGGSCTLGY